MSKHKLRHVHRHSWVSLFVCFLIWMINAYDREIVLRLAPKIIEEFGLSPEVWGSLLSIAMLALAVMAVPGSVISDRHGAGWKRAQFQVPLVIGYGLISALSGIKALSASVTSFIAMRIGVNLGLGWAEPVGISNTVEWWPREHRGFALGAHHTGYPLGAIVSGLVATFVLTTFGADHWRYALFFTVIIAVPLMLFWRMYSTKERIDELYADIRAKGLTAPEVEVTPGTANQGILKACLSSANIVRTAAAAVLMQIVYTGVNVVLPSYLFNVFKLSLAQSAGLSVVFAVTGVLGMIVWPAISDRVGRKGPLLICGVWLALSVAAFYFAHTITAIVIVQLLFGVVGYGMWPIVYALASDSAPSNAVSTANGVITTAIYVGSGLAPVIMGGLISFGGGWASAQGYLLCFAAMGVLALAGTACLALIRPVENAATRFSPAH